MGPPRTSVVLRSFVLLGLMLGGLTANASDPVPRYWTEMSFADVVLPPQFYWASEKDSTCRAGRGMWECLSNGCKLRIRTNIGNSKFDMDIWLGWQEQAPAQNCATKLASICKGNQGRVATVRGVRLGPVNLGGGLSRADQEYYAASKQAFRRELTQPIFDELLWRIEGYGIPCSCGGVPVGGPSALTEHTPHLYVNEFVHQHLIGAAHHRPPMHVRRDH